MTDERADDEELQRLVEEAGASRRRVRAGNLNDSLRDIHDNLLVCRRSLDRLDEILGRLILVKGRAATATRRAKEVFDDAFMDVVEGPRTRLRFPEYASAKERQALLTLAVRSHLSVVREAEDYEAKVDTALEYVRSCHKGVDSSRFDLNTRIRVAQLETSLER